MSTSRIRRRVARLFGVSSKDNASVVHNARTVPPVPERLSSREDVYKWIREGIGCFREWYQPVDFGNGVVAHQTRPPEWRPHPELLNDLGGGMAKWNYIIRKHIPDVSGKRALDLGCSSGLFSLELARMGAAEVIGIDRDVSIVHRSSNVPPPQDVIVQANFVKTAFELLEGRAYPVKYIAQDIASLAALNLGRFDLILALCVVYHELDRMPALVRTLANMTDYLVLQANEVHGGDLGRYANANHHVRLLEQIGFNQVIVDAPPGYMLPVIIATK